jgi:hypothetical protein
MVKSLTDVLRLMQGKEKVVVLKNQNFEIRLCKKNKVFTKKKWAWLIFFVE